jgi:hypothetical protein
MGLSRTTATVTAILIAAAIGVVGAARADAAGPGLRYFGYFAARRNGEIGPTSALDWLQQPMRSLERQGHRIITT